MWGLPTPDPASDEPRQNIARITFLVMSARDLLPDWESQVRSITAYLRHAAAHHPDDQELHTLIGELSVHSGDFTRIWSDHPVSDCLASEGEYRHPQVGTMRLNEEVVRLTDAPGTRITFSGADEGAESAERLRLLATLT